MVLDVSVLVIAVSMLCLGYAWYTSSILRRADPGPVEVRTIARRIKAGARAYLKTQFIYIGLVLIMLAAAFIWAAGRGHYNPLAPFAFLTGALLSATAGYVGMSVATSSSSRTCAAAQTNLAGALKVAFASGTVMGMSVVGLALLQLATWLVLLFQLHAYLPESERLQAVSGILITSGMGASLFALFARVGGGIFTKAADIAADLVGKLELGISEDDPRNPAAIADNVGDNVGDVAGMGADLYESYVGSMVASVALAIPAGLGVAGMLFPLLIGATGAIASLLGAILVRARESLSQGALLAALRRGTNGSALFLAAGLYFVVQPLFGQDRLDLYGCVLLGLSAGVLLGLSAEYQTSDRYGPTRRLAEASESGPATTMIAGLSLGMASTAAPVVLVGAAILGSFIISGGMSEFGLGLYGVGIAAVGMLSTLGVTLATDAYGPVADNAGGIAEMAHLPDEVRQRTDALDALGNTTAATGKGFAIGSAALTSLALLATYREQAMQAAARLGITVSFEAVNPALLIGLLLGAMLPFLFSSMTMGAVGRTAADVIREIRRQYEKPEISNGQKAPDYSRVIQLCTTAALREMAQPSILALAAPVIVGFLLGAAGVLGMLAGATGSGFALAVMMANAGAAWDNAKKWIEKGALGGKGSTAHKASIIGDTVGDPFKDTSGPSLNILIKLLAMVSLALVGLTVTGALL